jgi:hypothetical protein
MQVLGMILGIFNNELFIFKPGCGFPEMSFTTGVKKLPSTCCLLSAVYCLLSAVYCLLPASCCLLLSAVCCLLSAVYL